MGRTAKGRAAIKSALLSLMHEKPFAEISVSEICELAGVSRTTYYRNYYAQSDVLDDILDDCFGEVEELQGSMPAANPPSYEIDLGQQVAIYQMLLHIREHVQELVVILWSEKASVLERRIRAMAKRGLGIAQGTCPTDPHEYLYQEYTVAGMTRITCAWIQGNCEIPIEQMLSFEVDAARALATMEPSKLGV